MPQVPKFLRQADNLRFADFSVDLRAGKLRRNAIEVRLQDQPFQILAQLSQRAGEVVSRDELRRQVWPSGTFVDFDNSLNTAINKIREALGDSAEAPRFIETLPRQGYRFIAPLEESTNLTRLVQLAPRSEPVKAAHHRWRIVAAVLSPVIALAGLGYWTKQHFASPMTDKDTVVLADFENRTSEPVFDNTLKQALAVQLQQSPFLSLVPDQQTRETLRFMGRSPEERLVGAVAQEVCEREGASAMLQGGITSLGSHFVIDLNALDCPTGRSLARAETEVESKERVVAALGSVASQLRPKLGESLALVEKYDTPVLQATTPSLDALKAYSTGVIEEEKLNAGGALPFFKRAIELDANFALAYVGEAMAYDDTGEDELARASLHKAFELRDHVSEQEKLSITALYHGTVTGDSQQILEANRLWATMYPRERLPHDNLASYFNTTGAFDKALEESSTAVRIAPHSSSGYVNLASAYFGLNRWQESRAALEPIIARGQGDFAMYCFLYVAAWAQNDRTGMQRYLDSAQKSLSEGEMTRLQFTRAEEAASYGEFRTAHEMDERSEQIASELGLNQSAGAMAGLEALWQSQVGNRSAAREVAKQTLTKARGVDVAVNAAVALAVAGDVASAEAVADRLARQHPQDTVLNAVSLPLIRSNIELERGNATRTVELLRPSQPYELGFGFLYYPPFMPSYTRAQAYLKLRDGSHAGAEFRKILDHRGLDPNSPIYVLARLGLGRANALAGDVAGARSAYQDFLAAWTNADPDIPILKQAKAEYAKLQ
jgi:eukaryotic-like serine/threonine-protein kinase